MNYYNMIASEETSARYGAWHKYRKELTDYIHRGVEEYCTKGSWVAIWGAGGCNDIDILKLAKEYKLLLIDQDVDKLVGLRDKLKLSNDICRVADVGFWTILDQDYEMFEALLLDGANVDDIQIFLEELVEKMSCDFDLCKYSVEASVVVGLTSQLNSRFAALVHLHRKSLEEKHLYSSEDFKKIFTVLEDLNYKAVERLYVAIRQITENIVITGYEMKAFFSENEALNIIEEYKSLFDEGTFGGRYLSGREEDYIQVAGNLQWHQRLVKAIAMDALEDACMCDVLHWNFTDEKHYLMLMVSLRIHKKIK